MLLSKGYADTDAAVGHAALGYWQFDLEGHLVTCVAPGTTTDADATHSVPAAPGTRSFKHVLPNKHSFLHTSTAKPHASLKALSSSIPPPLDLATSSSFVNDPDSLRTLGFCSLEVCLQFISKHITALSCARDELPATVFTKDGEEVPLVDSRGVVTVPFLSSDKKGAHRWLVTWALDRGPRRETWPNHCMLMAMLASEYEGPGSSPDDVSKIWPLVVPTTTSGVDVVVFPVARTDNRSQAGPSVPSSPSLSDNQAYKVEREHVNKIAARFLAFMKTAPMDLLSQPCGYSFDKDGVVHYGAAPSFALDFHSDVVRVPNLFLTARDTETPLNDLLSSLLPGTVYKVVLPNFLAAVLVASEHDLKGCVDELKSYSALVYISWSIPPSNESEDSEEVKEEPAEVSAHSDATLKSLAKELRKLKKCLKQIEKLKDQASMTQAEKLKVLREETVRANIAELEAELL